MNQKQFYQWLAEIEKHFSGLKKWQAIGLTLISYGIIKARKSQASLIAEELPEFGKASTVERRIQRWIKNSRISKEALRRNWIAWILESIQAERIFLLVDETKLSNRMGCMMISVAIEKRAIPLAWRCYQANSKTAYPEEGQVEMIVKMLKEISSAAGRKKQFILEADRGIGNSSNLMKKVTEIGLDFMFRVKKNALFKPDTEENEAALIEFAHYGQEWKAAGTLFTRAHRQVKCHVHIIWEEGNPEPWCLATSLQGESGRPYVLRVWQEESFRDLKSGGWQWQNSLIRNPETMERLLFPMAIAYTWCITFGIQFLKMEKEWRSGIDSIRKHQKYCVFRMGLRLFKRYLFLCPDRLILQFEPLHAFF